MEGLLLYHYPCTDGAFAALAVHDALDRLTPVFVPHKITERLDLRALRDAHPHPDTELFLLDYCGPDAVWLREACELFERVHLLDHHKTAVEVVAAACGGCHNLIVELDMERSGATIALDWAGMSNTGGVRQLYAYVEDNDLFRHALPHSKAFTAGLASLRLEWDFNANPTLAATMRALRVKDLIDRGVAELDRTRVLIASYLTHRYSVLLPGTTTPSYAVDIAPDDYDITSQLGHELAAASPSGMGAVYREERVSLRSASAIKGVDTTCVSKVHYGGGGHAGASGFSITRLEWEKLKI